MPRAKLASRDEVSTVVCLIFIFTFNKILRHRLIQTLVESSGTFGDVLVLYVEKYREMCCGSTIRGMHVQYVHPSQVTYSVW